MYWIIYFIKSLINNLRSVNDSYRLFKISEMLGINTISWFLNVSSITISPIRDIIITIYRNYLIAKNKHLQTSKFGKLKTVLQHGMVLIILLLNPSQYSINLIVYINAIYAAATGVHYFVKNGF